MFSGKDVYEFVKADSSVTIGVLTCYLWTWLLVAGVHENAQSGPISWLFAYLADVGITVPDWIRNILLSPQPNLLLLMFVAALSLAYCAHLTPAVLILAMEWHSAAAVWQAYGACLLVLALTTAVLARVGTETLTPGYAVTVKVLVPGVLVIAYPVLVVLGMFEKFTTPRGEGPTFPGDWHLLESTPLECLTAADLARVLRIAKDVTYIIPPKKPPPTAFPSVGWMQDSA